ncbi:hypothetical protein GOZ89_22770 [Agrobacterium vitis]|uniref:DUF6894 family protein n=1 Tax=Agrobacterium vitis TaxID=373 RepID=UPI0012E81239|nr:hypothetical protein [Agrobacterium vitis]MVA37773.1 hypothetical protein [Agrobacterium vitis]MVA82237.1 hypothetical protein [Agrobacterium vitis]
MQRFFFHIIHSDHRVEDPEGALFPSLAAAHEEATATLCDLIADVMTIGEASGLMAIDIADEDSVVLERIVIDQAIGKILVMLR